MNVYRIVVGELEENCYILVKGNDCLIVDPGSDEKQIFDFVGTKNVLGVLVTHHHFDHVGALKSVLNKYKCDLYDFETLEEKEYKIGDFDFFTIFNPGHTKDSVSYYFKNDNMMFVGDFVFLGTVGRCDLEGGDINEMRKSITNLKQIQEDVVLYPGHGLKTTLNFEKENNPYF